jgi:hypothetical protein
VAKKLPENDFQKSSKAAELQEAHREMRGIRFIAAILNTKIRFRQDYTENGSSY